MAKIVLYQVPGMSEFVFKVDGFDIWMECLRCSENWQVDYLSEAVEKWNEHVCKEKQP